jgi:Recombination endonuclease VII
MIKSPRKCARCSAAIPPERRRFHARFCSSACRCKSAQATYVKTPKWKANNIKWCAEYHRRHRYGQRAYYAYRLRLNHGVTIEDADAMVAKQGGVCAICGHLPIGRRLQVDKDLKTGKVFRMICRRCVSATMVLKRWAGHIPTSRSSLRRARLASAARVPRTSG